MFVRIPTILLLVALSEALVGFCGAHVIPSPDGSLQLWRREIVVPSLNSGGYQILVVRGTGDAQKTLQGIQPPVAVDWSNKLGAGGQGAVYSGNQGGKPVIVKTAHAGDDGIQNSWRIAQLAPKNHPNLMEVTGLGKTSKGDNALVTAKYNDGDMFGRAVSGFYDKNPDTLKTDSLQVANGLQALHSKKLLHNDLSLVNVMVDGKNMRLIDHDRASTFAGKSSKFFPTYIFLYPRLRAVYHRSMIDLLTTSYRRGQSESAEYPSD